MQLLTTFKEFGIYMLDEDLANAYVSEIVASLDLIPKVDCHTDEDVIGVKKGERILHAKWEHSFIALQNKEFAGIIIGYEREKENNTQYPENCIYLSDLAVAQRFQNNGLGKFLSRFWLDWNKKVGFLKLSGRLKFCVQTNKEEWNNHVQKMYESLGFVKVSEKHYGNRTDNIYALNV